MIQPVDPALTTYTANLSRRTQRCMGRHNRRLNPNNPVRDTLLPALSSHRRLRHPNPRCIHDGQRHAQNGLTRQSLNPHHLGLRLQRTSDSNLQNHGNPPRTPLRSVRHNICALLCPNPRTVWHGRLIRRHPVGTAAIRRGHSDNLCNGQSRHESNPRQIHRVNHGDEQLQAALHESGAKADLDTHQIHHLRRVPNLHHRQCTHTSPIRIERVNAVGQRVGSINSLVAWLTCDSRSAADLGYNAQRIHTRRCSCYPWHHQLDGTTEASQPLNWS